MIRFGDKIGRHINTRVGQVPHRSFHNRDGNAPILSAVYDEHGNVTVSEATGQFRHSRWFDDSRQKNNAPPSVGICGHRAGDAQSPVGQPGQNQSIHVDIVRLSTMLQRSANGLGFWVLTPFNIVFLTVRRIAIPESGC